MFNETPVMSCPIAWIVRPVGMASSASRFSTCDFVVLCTSTVGAAPVTVNVSSSEPTFLSIWDRVHRPGQKTTTDDNKRRDPTTRNAEGQHEWTRSIHP